MATPIKASRIITVIARVTIPRIITDNPCAEFASKDGKFRQRIPINANIVRFMADAHEAYVRIKMTTLKIISMEKVSEEEYNAPISKSEAESQVRRASKRGKNNSEEI